MKKMYASLAEYNKWANSRMITCLEKLSESQRQKELAGSFPTIQKTAAHIWDAEVIWYERLVNNTFPEDFPGKNFHGSFDAFKKGWLKASQNWIDWIEAQNDAVFSESFSYQNTRGDAFTQQKGQVISHVFNHSTFHRGQLVTMMRQVEFTGLLQTDYIKYLRDQS